MGGNPYEFLPWIHRNYRGVYPPRAGWFVP
nr:MAG TPA: hypothetical protein [Caudoviricetes sp.]